MYYSWGNKDFVKSLSLLRKMIASETNEDKKYYLESILAHESNLYFTEFDASSIYIKDPSNKEKLLNIASNLNFYEREYKVLASYAEMLDSIFGSIEELTPDVESFDEEITRTYVKHDELLEIAKDIIGNMDDEFYKIYMNFYKDRFKSVKFYGVDDPLAKAEVNGDSNYIDQVNRIFVRVKNSIGVDKIACFLHEFGHITSMVTNPQKWHLCSSSFYDEIESTFFELVAMFEIRGDFPEDQINLYLYDFLFSKMDDLNILNWQRVVVNLWKDNNYAYNPELLKTLKEKTGLTQNVVKNILNTSITDNGTYIFSYAIAVKLFRIYKQDKKEAIRLLKKIMAIPYDKIIEVELRKIIRVDDSLFSESKKIVDDMRLTLARNGFNN